LLQAAMESAPTAAPATSNERTRVEVMWSPWDEVDGVVCADATGPEYAEFASKRKSRVHGTVNLSVNFRQIPCES
jgi:hypothetical protein